MSNSKFTGLKKYTDDNIFKSTKIHHKNNLIIKYIIDNDNIVLIKYKTVRFRKKTFNI